MTLSTRLALAAGVGLLAFTAPLAAPVRAQSTSVAKPNANAPYWNAALPTEQRVNDLLQRMTLEEKVAQMISTWLKKGDIQGADDGFDPAKASAKYPDGIGFFTRPSDRKGAGSPRETPPRSIEQSVAYVNAVQSWARGHTRLGIPVLAHEEALHGLATRDATSFPIPIGLASTWNPDLVRDANAVIAGEVRARGVTQVLSPVVDVARDPRWGRIEETFGEDPYLVGELGVAAVEGLQGVGKDPKLKPGKVLATLKHLTGHGQPGKRHQRRPRLARRTHAARVLLPAVQTSDRPHRDRRGDGKL